MRVPAARKAAIAESLQADLYRRHTANVRRWFDFEHKAGVASALPKAFRDEARKGIMRSLGWTGATQNIANEGQAVNIGKVWGDSVVVAHVNSAQGFETPTLLRTST